MKSVRPPESRSWSLPDAATLTGALEAALARRTRLIERRSHEFASSFPGEIVRCRLDEGADVCLLCKYEAGGRAPSFGHRRGPTL